MMTFDYNAFVGTWPFYKTRFGSFSDLRLLHRENGIEGGLVSSIQAIFYNDPWEAEEELAKTLHNDPNYRHVFTINPQLPAWKEDISRAVSMFGIYGVRIVPGYHRYEMDDPCLDELCTVLKKYQLPLFITMHLIDERAAYLMLPHQVEIDKLSGFIRKSGIRTMICNARVHELHALWPLVEEGYDIWFDMSGLKDQIFVMEDLFQKGMCTRLKYGSQMPILCLQSSKLLLDLACIPDEVKEQILSDQF